MNKLLASALMLLFSVNNIISQEVTVNNWLIKYPVKANKPAFISGADINQNEFSSKNLLTENYISLKGLKPLPGKVWNPGKTNKEGFVNIDPLRKYDNQLAYFSFYLESDGLNEMKIEVESPQMFEVYLSGKKISSNYTLAEEGKTVKRTGTIDVDPGKYVVIVKSLYTGENKNDWLIKAILNGVPDNGVTLSVDPNEKMTIHHLLEGPKLSSMSLSPVARSYM